MNLIKKLETIQHLQSTSEIEFFNLIKDKTIDKSTFPTNIIYATDTFTELKQKLSSKRWYNVNISITNLLIYFDYTSSASETYIITIAIEFSPCNLNPVTSVNCVSTSRSDQLGNSIDEVIPSIIVQEASNSLIPTSNTNTETIALIIGAGIILYYLTKK